MIIARAWIARLRLDVGYYFRRGGLTEDGIDQDLCCLHTQAAEVREEDMMVAALERLRVWTAADLLSMPDDADHRYELVEGRLMRMSPTGGTHGRRSMDLGAHLAMYVEQ